MPGFEFHYRTGGGNPTVRGFLFKDTETFTRGDLLNLEKGKVDLGVAGDTALLGMAIETLRGDSSTTYVRVITDADAVYGVTDANARERGDHLALVGATGQQGVVTSAGSDLLVVESSTAEDETLVTILPEAHHALLEGEGRVRPVGGELNAAIARAVVRYQRVQTGRGPTRAQAFYRGEVVVVVLEEMMSKAERSLLEHGRIDAVRHMREAFQEASRDDLVAIVESLTGTRVRSFMSANDLARDVSVEVFLLDNPIWSE